MNRWPLVAIKDFEFKGKSYASGDRFELPIGEAYKVISRRQAKRATATAYLGVDLAADSDLTGQYPAPNPAPAVEPEPPAVEQESAAQPEVEAEQAAEEEKPRRRRRRQSSYEAEGVPHESSEREWNSE